MDRNPMDRNTQVYQCGHHAQTGGESRNASYTFSNFSCDACEANSNNNNPNPNNNMHMLGDVLRWSVALRRIDTDCQTNWHTKVLPLLARFDALQLPHAVMEEVSEYPRLINILSLGGNGANDNANREAAVKSHLKINKIAELSEHGEKFTQAAQQENAMMLKFCHDEVEALAKWIVKKIENIQTVVDRLEFRQANGPNLPLGRIQLRREANYRLRR